MNSALGVAMRAVVSILLLFTLALGGVAQAKGPGKDTLSIAQARTAPIGSVVTVSGTVSTPPGAFASSFFDLGFGLQDDTAGIFVSSQVLLGAHLGDKARVTGALQDSFGLLILVPASPSGVAVGEDGPPVLPEFVSTAGVGESTEGSIVQVVGTVSQAVSSDLPYGYKFAVDDGSGPIQIFINTQTGIDSSALTPGDTVSVTGFSSQFDTHYEIDPRRPKDIKIRRH